MKVGSVGVHWVDLLMFAGQLEKLKNKPSYVNYGFNVSKNLYVGMQDEIIVMKMTIEKKQ